MSDGPEFGLYVHWPFCQSKCPYCDFNSHVAGHVQPERWHNAFVSELERAGHDVPGRKLSSIFFGGGTPSLMDPVLVRAIIDQSRMIWPVSDDIEISLEANPSSVEARRFRAYAEAGVNRISIGVQSFRDEDLRKLGRLHSSTQARQAIDIARAAFPRVSFDLIYARQDQSLDDWRVELSEAIDTGVDHLSLYQLTIEDGTVFGERHRRGILRGLPDEDLAADMFDLTQELTGQAGLSAYEVSNHARPGQECRHNLNYWKSGSWIGLGPGAHGRISIGSHRYATESYLLPDAWLSAVEKKGSGESLRAELSDSERFEETVLMGLRLEQGMPMRLIDQDLLNKNNGLIEDGLLEHDTNNLWVTPKGRPLLNRIVVALLA